MYKLSAEILAILYDWCEKGPLEYYWRNDITEQVRGNPSSTDGKHRETWLPVELERTINRYVQHEGIESGESLIDQTKRSVQFWVENATEQAAAETDGEDYQRVSSHR